MKIYRDIVQGTTQWANVRAGLPTASELDNIITPSGKASTSAKRYMHRLLAERVLGKPIEAFKSPWMEHGNQFEDKAVSAFEFEMDVTTEKIGFVTNDAGTVGCSPDRFIVERPTEMLECKAPAPETHCGYLLAEAGDGVEKEYKVQLQAELWLCEKEKVWVTSFHPDFPNATFCVNRDEEFIKTMAALVNAFAMQLAEKTELLKQRGVIKAPEPVELGPEWLTAEDLAWAMNRPASDFANYKEQA